MGCCDSMAPVSEEVALASGPGGRFDAWVTEPKGGISHLDLIVPEIHCAGCISKIERALNAVHGVEHARVNFSTKRVAVDWKTGETNAETVAATLTGLGYEVRPFRSDGGESGDREGKRLLTAMAVAGFAAGNVMLLSVSVWAGAELATKDLFHWLSALIALPAVIYAGGPFYRSAWKAVRHGRMNMDVPISLAVILAAAMSLHETIVGGPDAYFDASVMLLFFLLVGRYLDHMMRTRARQAVSQLVSLGSKGAMVEGADGVHYLPIESVSRGDTVLVAAGETVPVDGTVLSGETAIDMSLVTGESLPERVGPGAMVRAGTLNLDAPLRVEVTAAGEDTFLADVVRLMESAEQRKDKYVRLADKAARIYAPVVHLVALFTFIGWMLAGAGTHSAAITAIAVLIITCPCALALAVPAVQVVAVGALFRGGVMVKDGAALEKLAEIDTAVFDKTGTLTLGRPGLVAADSVPSQLLAEAAGLAKHSRHPLSRAVVAAAKDRGIAPAPMEEVTEVPGHGVQGQLDGRTVRMGSLRWLGVDEDRDDASAQSLKLAVTAPDGSPDGFGEPLVLTFEDEMRPDAARVIADLQARKVEVVILSGDREAAVAPLARALGVGRWHAGLLPQDKVREIEALSEAGRKVLVVGDGLNDGPALAAGYTSIAPSSASDLGRTAADFVFFGDSLAPVTFAGQVARRARRLVLQNFNLARVYNVIAVPTAIAGFASPLVAAIAMSSSSVIVIGNALRLRAARKSSIDRAVGKNRETHR
ncbi:MAG: heavy metal translocating P-type ATPase [Alphaproteobacteria bacterium]|nr:heavy metal translocating P-type ATPase [Alphaproteobacteria bacterium]